MAERSDQYHAHKTLKLGLGIDAITDDALKTEIRPFDFKHFVIALLSAILTGVQSFASGAGNVGAAHWAPVKGAALANGTTTVAARATRRSIVVTCDDDSTADVLVGAASGVATHYITLKPGFSQEIETTAAIFLKSAGGAGTFTAVETYD